MQANLRIAYLVSHPIQYQVPLIRSIAKIDGVSLSVFYKHMFSLHSYKDIGFNKKISWDVDLTSGYKYTPLSNQPKKHLRSLKIIWEMTKHLKKGKYDVLWLHGYASQEDLAIIIIARLLKVKILLRGETNLICMEKSLLRNSFRKCCFYIFKRFINGFLSIGTLNQQFYQHFGIPSDKIFHCPYTVDNDFFRLSDTKKNVKQSVFGKFNLDPNRPIILYAGKMIERKNPLLLLNAYIDLSQNNLEPLPYLIYVGSGAILNELKQKASQTHWDSIRFLGFQNQSQLPELYQMSDIYVMPSSQEPWGLGVNEAMAAGCAIIASSDVGCAVDLIKPGKNGYIFENNNQDALTHSLKLILDDAEKLNDMQHESMNIIDQWSIKQSTNGLMEACGHFRETAANYDGQ